MEIVSVQNHHPAPSATPVTSAEVRAETRDLIQAVKALNATELFGQNNELTFVMDRESRRPVIRIVDRETGEVVRQIPQEHALRMAADLARAGQRHNAI